MNRLSATSVLIRWHTNEPSTSQVEYGLTLVMLWRTLVDPTLVTNHEVIIDGLLPGTTYYYRVRSITGGGEELISRVWWFRTWR